MIAIVHSKKICVITLWHPNIVATKQVSVITTLVITPIQLPSDFPNRPLENSKSFSLSMAAIGPFSLSSLLWGWVPILFHSSRCPQSSLQIATTFSLREVRLQIETNTHGTSFFFFSLITKKSVFPTYKLDGYWTPHSTDISTQIPG